MLEPDLPTWARNSLPEMIDGFLGLIADLYQRCEKLSGGHRRDCDGYLCDDYGNVNDYRLDAKYSAGQVVRLRAALQERLSPTEWAESPYCKLPQDPRDLAPWAWDNPYKRLRVLPPEPPKPAFTWTDFYHKYDELERRVLVYRIGEKRSFSEIAERTGRAERKVREVFELAFFRFEKNGTGYDIS